LSTAPSSRFVEREKDAFKTKDGGTTGVAMEAMLVADAVLAAARRRRSFREREFATPLMTKASQLIFSIATPHTMLIATVSSSRTALTRLLSQRLQLSQFLQFLLAVNHATTLVRISELFISLSKT
jgi:hypothetical protein